MTYTVKIGTNRAGDGTSNDNNEQIELDQNLGLSPLQQAAVSAAVANRLSREKAKLDDLQRELDEIKVQQNLQNMDKAIAGLGRNGPYSRNSAVKGPLHEQLLNANDSEVDRILSRLNETETQGVLGRIFGSGATANKLALANKDKYRKLRDLARRYGVVC